MNKIGLASQKRSRIVHEVHHELLFRPYTNTENQPVHFLFFILLKPPEVQILTEFRVLFSGLNDYAIFLTRGLSKVVQ